LYECKKLVHKCKHADVPTAEECDAFIMKLYQKRTKSRQWKRKRNKNLFSKDLKDQQKARQEVNKFIKGTYITEDKTEEKYVKSRYLEEAPKTTRASTENSTAGGLKLTKLQRSKITTDRDRYANTETISTLQNALTRRTAKLTRLTQSQDFSSRQLNTSPDSHTQPTHTEADIYTETQRTHSPHTNFTQMHSSQQRFLNELNTSKTLNTLNTLQSVNAVHARIGVNRGNTLDTYNFPSARSGAAATTGRIPTAHTDVFPANCRPFTTQRLRAKTAQSSSRNKNAYRNRQRSPRLLVDRQAILKRTDQKYMLMFGGLCFCVFLFFF
jgi:hypothetical protein